LNDRPEEYAYPEKVRFEIIHNNELVIPYAMSDINSGIATVGVKELFSRMHMAV